ncbi:hypothetical protein Tco_0545090 [Tanacetum coccineum]
MGWKNIMSLRDKVKKHIWWKLGNGKYVNVWHDRWCSVSPLSDFITTRDMYDVRLRNECTVREVIHEGRWKWPAEWNNDFTELDQLQVPMLKEDVEDKDAWKSENGSEKKFMINSVWKDLNAEGTTINWYKLVCFTQYIPRHAFVTCKCIDSHNHMFFTCELSNEVCKELVKLINVRLSEGWDQIIMEMVALPLNKNIWSIMRRIVCSTTVYYIWQERNNRLFKNEHRTKDKLLSIIKETIILKLAGLTVKESNTVKEVEDKWGPSNKFTWYKNKALNTRIAAYSNQTRPDLTFVSTSWRHSWDQTLGITLRKMSAMANTTPIVTTVTKPATKEKMPKDADATPRVNIQDFCEEYYEDILPVIMDKIHRDKRKEVYAMLDFKESPKKRRIREGSQNSSARTLSARYRNPSDRLKVRDRLRYNDRHVLDRLGIEGIVLTVEVSLTGRTLLTEIVLRAETAPATSKNRTTIPAPPTGRGPNTDIALVTKTALVI